MCALQNRVVTAWREEVKEKKVTIQLLSLIIITINIFEVPER
jgi:hypothetical protein